MTTDGSKLVIGGSFTHVDGSSQNHIAAVSPTSGATLSWSTHTSYAIVGVAADSAGIYAAGAGSGGNFAAFNPSSGSMKWQGGTNGNVQAITAFNGEVYAGGHYTDYCGPQGGQHTCTNPIPRSKMLAVDENTGALQSWAPSVNSALGVFALAGGAGLPRDGRRLHEGRRHLPAGLRDLPPVTPGSAAPGRSAGRGRAIRAAAEC